jgi:hypothetical protein
MKAAVPLTVAAAALALFAVAFDRQWFPLGIPEEWVWDRLRNSNFAKKEFTAFVLSAIVAVGLAALVARCLPIADRLGRRAFLSLIVAICLLGALFQLSVEISSPQGLCKWGLLCSEQIESYFVVSQRDCKSVSDALVNHRRRIEKLPPHHASVNPAGWYVVDRAVIEFYESHPTAAERVFQQTPDEMAWFYFSVMGRRYPYAVHASLATIVLINRLASWLVGLPIAWLVTMRVGRRAALVAAAACYLAPAHIMFAPRVDTVYATFAATILALSCYASRARSWRVAALAGALAGGGLFFSLSYLVVAAIAGIFAAGEWWKTGRPDYRALAAATGAYVTAACLPLVAGYEPFGVWSINLAKNSQFNALWRGSAWWRVVNPLEFAVGLGLPVAALLLFRLWHDVRKRRFDTLLWSWLAVLALLDISGANQGEVARLWIFMMPLAIALAVEWLGYEAPRASLAIVCVILLQAAACVVLARDLAVMGDKPAAPAQPRGPQAGDGPAYQQFDRP